VATPSEISSRLLKQGWASLSLGTARDLPEHIVSIAQDLGSIIVRRRGESIETIAPQRASSAPAASLSRQFGLDALPLHSDTAHWTVPCRYIVLACAQHGSVSTPTLLVDAHDPGFSEAEHVLLRSSTFIVRNGGNSFYGSLVDRKKSFIRFDPGCMLPLADSSVTAMGLYGMKRQRQRVISYDWEDGNVLIIDNWRMLHGRGNETPADRRRQLLRVYVQ
jgi:alpha-ketoglutarate-dependent taurine dioxygenase